MTTGVQRTSRRNAPGILIAVVLAVATVLAPWGKLSPTARAASTPVPKAVFVVGPTNGLTDSNLAEAEKMAQQAEAAGMDVRRVFFPHATWDNVLANIQGANLVVYMGHGYGWPSPYTAQLTESRQNGMGLNTFDGSGKDKYTYYGAKLIKESIVLAPNAIVYLNHLCYAAGNGEPGMSTPSEDTARQRVDNMANGWLAAGARAVFAYTWKQKLDYPNALMTSNASVDELFMTSSNGSPSGFVGEQDKRFASERTPGATNHLDPHNNYGYSRAVTGDLAMTMAEWRSSAAGTQLPPPPDPGGAPQITSLTAGVGGTAASATGPVAFHPNGDGIDEELMLRHTVTREAHLDATVKNSQGQTVRTYSVWSAAGSGGSRWNGKDNAGRRVADGRYTLTYVPRDSAGVVGTPVSTESLVLTAIALAKPSTPAMFGSDADALAKATKLTVTLNQQAQVGWRMLDAAGAVVLNVRSPSSASVGKLRFTWDGRASSGAFVPDGWYRSVVSATTSLGSYVQERLVYVGAFRVTPSIASPARGGKLTLTIISTEALAGALRVRFSQPGLDSWDATATRIEGKRYKLTVTLPTGGGAGMLALEIIGTDKEGGTNRSSTSLSLR